MGNRLKIEKLVYGGDGLARTQPDAKGRRMAVFVPFTLPDETVEAGTLRIKGGMARAELESVVEPAAERQQPPCPHFGKCGGCHLQHGSYNLQLDAKQTILRETLERARIKVSTEIDLLSAGPWSYRNRIRLHLRTAPQWQAGYLERNSHRLLEIAECPIAAPLLQSAIKALALPEVARHAPNVLEQVELFCNQDGSQATLNASVTAPAGDFAAEFERWIAALQFAMPQFVGAVAVTRTSDSLENRVVATTGSPALTYRVERHDYHVSATSFFQVNLHLLDKLVALVTSPLIADLRGQASARVFDLYAGAGLFSVPLADAGLQVTAVESAMSSSADLATNLLPFGNATTVRSTTEQFLARTKLRPNAILLDPPRAGLGAEVTQQLVRIGSPTLAYLSCDPTTLARDLQPLLAAGYHIVNLTWIDLFPQTFHIETFVLLKRS
jgi:23S rRNA (uracil1939-C5)-methyltransferase